MTTLSITTVNNLIQQDQFDGQQESGTRVKATPAKPTIEAPSHKKGHASHHKGLTDVNNTPDTTSDTRGDNFGYLAVTIFVNEMNTNLTTVKAGIGHLNMLSDQADALQTQLTDLTTKTNNNLSGETVTGSNSTGQNFEYVFTGSDDQTRAILKMNNTMTGSQIQFTQLDNTVSTSAKNINESAQLGIEDPTNTNVILNQEGRGLIRLENQFGKA